MEGEVGIKAFLLGRGKGNGVNVSSRVHQELSSKGSFANDKAVVTIHCIRAKPTLLHTDLLLLREFAVSDAQ